MTKIDKQIAEQLYDPKKVSWRSFLKVRMGPYMRKYRSHGAAIRQIAKEWKDYNKKRVMVGSKSKSKSGSWLDFVKSHKHLRTAKGLIDLKAISKLWKLKSKAYDPGWNKGRKNTLWNRVSRYRRQEPVGGHIEIQDVKSHIRRTYDPPPPNWYHAMLQGIKKSSDVRNPGAIVGSIWRRLSPSKKAEIKARDAKGERFKYDLPLPDDRPTRGTGTLRMVKPFKLAEVQVNLSAKDYIAAIKSGLFSKMKRNDGTIALVARCKSEKKNCNIFVDKVR